MLTSFIGLISVSSVTSKANSDYSIKATTKVPLNYQILELAKDNIHYRLASSSYAKFLKSDGMTPDKKISAGTRIKIYNQPALKHGGYKYYPVTFLTKKYAHLYKFEKGVFPTIAIKNFHQLKHVNKVN
ncbi:hypothetical protein FD06_GL000787 [Apilactobacillus ozensis DSM 23829 = JCM 17196]|uniref:Uncharacterized protein n=1 Tax=Apilactobacillus ozensis DSM 23829 = JCM 17196 TaxID=1423781 RepID=A0A0R2AWM7_9LACO|nr:hypothetical protein FD06_GL000787 [Apilactobacillus ozensis DSM 23829 = JCM 17196]